MSSGRGLREGNLPIALSSFVGRQRELLDIGVLLRGHRLVTLTGAGGAGKTRLAQRAAADAIHLHDGGSWWLELAPLASGAQVTERLLHVFWLDPGTSGTDPLSILGRDLRTRGPTLLVLDNAEHIVDAVATLAQSLLEACPELRLLVTSREPLGVPGEVVWRVPSLATPPTDAVVPVEHLREHDATQLFVERALAARPNLVLDDGTAAAVVAICARLDGIPLAIELAAARARTMPLQRVAEGLDEAFRLLTGGARTALPRQQTLLASIAWSVDLLDERDEAVFHRLAVFAGPFTIDAAEVVVADGDAVDPFDVLDSLSRLVDKSLVQLDDASGRYRLLETVRQWGLDRLRQLGELASVRSRHAQWCASWAEGARTLRHGIDAEPLLATVPDVRAALEWSMPGEPDVVLRVCAGLGRFFSILGPSTCNEVLDWILALEPGDVDACRWANAVEGIANTALVLERLDVLALVPDAVSTLEGAGAPVGPGLRSIQHAPQMFLGRSEGYESLCDEMVEQGDDLTAKTLATAIALFAAVTGDLPKAHRHLGILNDVLRRWDLPVTPDTAGFGYAAAIELAIVEGRLDDARALAHPVLTGAQTEHAVSAASLTARLGRLTDDGELLSVPVRWADDEVPVRMRQGLAALRLVLAQHAGDRAAAADHGITAWTEGEVNGVLRSMSVVPIVAALLADDRLDEARRVVVDWSVDVESYGTAPLPVANAHYVSALLARHEDRDADAADAAHESLELAHRCGFHLLAIDVLLLLVDLSARRSNELTAARLAGAATAARERIGHRAPLLEHPGHLDALIEQLSLDEPAAFAEGRTLDLDAAVAYARRMRGERGRPAFGWDSLTPTERQVSELAAGGATNAQIAEQLLVKPATVKTHLTHVFAKLGVANRTELAHAWTSRTSDA